MRGTAHYSNVLRVDMDLCMYEPRAAQITAELQIYLILKVK